MTRDLGRIKNELKPMLTTLHEAIRVYGRKDAEPKKDGVRHSTDLIDVLSLIEKIEKLDSAGKIQGGVVQSDNEKEREVFNKLERDLGECTQNMASDFIRRMSAEDSSGNSTFDNMEVKEDDSVTDVCIDVIKGHAIELGLSATLEYGFYVGGFKNRLADAFENGTEMQGRLKKVGPLLAGRNRKLDAKRADMLTAISYNISRAAAAMKLKPGEKLSDVALRHAVLNMGLVDKKLVESIASLSEANYNSLIADAGKKDSQISVAVSILRGAEVYLNEIEIEEAQNDEQNDE